VDSRAKGELFSRVKMELAEFEDLVAEIQRQDPQIDCVDRLRWMDSLVEKLRFQLAKALALNRVLMRAAGMVAEDDWLEREIDRMTLRILRQEAGDDKWHEKEDGNHSSQTCMLTEFAKKTH